MKSSLVIVALAAPFLAAPAFAQSHVQSGTGTVVSSGTGGVVTPGVPIAGASVLVPATTVMGAAPATLVTAPTFAGAVLVPAGSTETVEGNTRTIVTRYWVNVPAGVEADPRFRRWMQLQ